MRVTTRNRPRAALRVSAALLTADGTRRGGAPHGGGARRGGTDLISEPPRARAPLLPARCARPPPPVVLPGSRDTSMPSTISRGTVGCGPSSRWSSVRYASPCATCGSYGCDLRLFCLASRAAGGGGGGAAARRWRLRRGGGGGGSSRANESRRRHLKGGIRRLKRGGSSLATESRVPRHSLEGRSR